MIFQFASPYFLLLFLLLPVLLILLGRSGKKASVVYSDISLAKSVSSKIKTRAGSWIFIGRVFALSLIILALARPQFGERISNVETEGIDIILGIDLSSSMFAHDFKIKGENVDRLTAVKEVVKDFIKKRPNDRIGIVAFSGAPYLVSPLTLNHGWLLQNLERLKIGLIEDGTAIGKAIGTGVSRLKDLESKSKVIILLTDGSNNDPTVSPTIAAEAAEAFGVKIYTIAAGMEGIVPFPMVDRNYDIILDRFGRKRFDRVQSDIDTATLEEIAKITHAKSYRATDTEELENIYEEIDELEKNEVKLTVKSNYNDLFHYLLAAASVLLFIEFILHNTRYRSFP
jgi:Ca-activated chloride channel family protein